MYAFILMTFVLFIREKKLSRKLIIKTLPFLLLMIGIVFYKLISSSDYEKGVITDFIYQLSHKEISFSYLKSLFEYLISFHWKGLILLVVTSTLLITQKKYKFLFLFTVFFIGTATTASFLSSSFDPSRYNEQVYFPLWFLVIFTLFYCVFKDKTQPFKQCLLAVFAILGMLTILKTDYYSNRLAEIHSLIKHCQTIEGKKFYINQENLKYDPNWSYPIETLLFSAKQGKKYSLTICLSTDMAYKNNFTQLNSDQFLFRRWDIKSIRELNPKHFILNTKKYKKIGL